MNPRYPVFSLLLLCLLYSCTGGNTRKESATETWPVPDSVNQLQNAYKNEQALTEGKANFKTYCSICHGETGMGDGVSGGMGIIPANFRDEKVQEQSDGAIFWKISTGKGNMPSFEEALTESQRWGLVTFIRQIGKGEVSMERSPPMALREGIQIEHFMNVAPRAIRIMHDPVSNTLWYATFEGDVFRIHVDGEENRAEEKMATVEDHGVIRMQGAAIRGNTLFVSGNVRVNDNKGTTGKMSRIDFLPNGEKKVTNVFTTVEYGTTNSPFDHGWSATEFSPDGKYIFVVSGSRTDHGEIQDNLGAYPNSRDEPLTARLFRFRVETKDLILPNDEKSLEEAGYIYAKGIRNAFDIAFDVDDNLFAVVNSGDYDQSEDMFWVREGHHYGFPWIMGGLETPQQFPDWYPDPDKDPFINTTSAAWPDGYYNDPTYPKRPEDVEFTPGIRNFGPDANEYRDRESGKVMDGSDTGQAVQTFTAHSSPLGLVFDVDKVLAGDLKGAGFALRYSKGEKSSLMKPFTEEGEDLLHLDLKYNREIDNFDVNITRIADGFVQPIDAVLVKNELYVIEYGGRRSGAEVWKVILPEE